MRASVILVALLLGCVYEPTEIARFETSEEGSADPSIGSGAFDLDEADLREGAIHIVDLGILDMEVLTFGEGVHPVVIEIVPIQPATLPIGFSASIHPVDGEATFEASGAGLRYEGDLQLGWSVFLHADEPSIVELRAQIIE